MSTIVTRAGKGSPLTHTEMDANLTNLNTDKAELSNLASTDANKGADLIGINDTGSKFTGTTVESALQEATTLVQLAATGATDGATLVGFKNSEISSAVASTLALRGSRNFWSVFDVMTAAEISDVRARTASVDVTAKIQDIITKAGAAGGRAIYFPEGTYKVSATITNSSSTVSLIGAGMWSCLIYRTGDYGATLKFTGDDATGTLITNCGISGFRFQSAGLTTSGAHIHINGVAQCDISNISMANGFIGFDFQAMTAAYISNVYLVFTNIFGGAATGRKFMRFRAAAATYAHPSCGDVFVTDFNLRGNIANTNTEVGLEINSADGIWFENGHIGNTTVANLRLNANDAANHIGLVFFTTVMFDENNGIGCEFLGGSVVGRNIQFSNCNFKGGGSGTQGIVANATATFNNVQFNNCFVTEYNSYGINIAAPGALNWTITDCQVRGNSYTSTNTADGIAISEGNKIQIIGGQSGGHNVVPGTSSQRYGLQIGANALNVLVDSIDLRGNLTKSLIVNGSAQPTTTVGSAVKTDDSLTIASASTLVLPEVGEVFHVSGTTTISNIQVTRTGRRYTLIFDGILSFTDAGNKVIAGALTTAANTTISLVFDGTNHYETSRSVN